MKKTLFLIALVLICAPVIAQDEQDAARLQQTDIVGSARYVGMGGAFSALGGDITAVKDNPAGLGVFRKTDCSVSLEVPTSVSKANWNNQRLVKDTRVTFDANHIGAAINFGGDDGKTKGLVSHTLGLNFQRVKTFNRTLYLTGQAMPNSILDSYSNTAQSDNYSTDKTLLADNAYENTHQAWPSVLAHDAGVIVYDSLNQSFGTILKTDETINSRYKLRESGYIDEYNIAWGCNISNIVYLGAGVNVTNMRYTLNSTTEETFSKGGDITAENYQQTRGVGWNANVGVIAVPVEWVRLGASFRTPTLWSLTDQNKGELTFEKYYATPLNSFSYKFRQPMRLNAGAAFVIKQMAIISAEYEYNRSSKAKYKIKGDPEAYADVNANMPYANLNTHTLKVGVEVKPIDWLAIRAGYDYMSAITPKNYEHEIRYNTVRTDSEWSRFKGAQYISGGLGFRGNWWYLDLAYQYRAAKEDYYTYSNTAYGPKGKVTTNDTYANQPATSTAIRHTATATFGVRF